MAKEQLAISSSTPPGEKETPLSRQHPAHFFFFLILCFFVFFFLVHEEPLIAEKRKHISEGHERWLLYYILVPMLRNPCSSYTGRGEKKKNKHTKTIGAEGPGQTNQRSPSCSAVQSEKGNVQSPARNKLKCFLTLGTGILNRVILWLKEGGEKMRILKSAFEFQLPPHSKPWPEVCRTVDVLES